MGRKGQVTLAGVLYTQGRLPLEQGPQIGLTSSHFIWRARQTALHSQHRDACATVGVGVGEGVRARVAWRRAGVIVGTLTSQLSCAARDREVCAACAWAHWAAQKGDCRSSMVSQASFRGLHIRPYATLLEGSGQRWGGGGCADGYPSRTAVMVSPLKIAARPRVGRCRAAAKRPLVYEQTAASPRRAPRPYRYRSLSRRPRSSTAAGTSPAAAPRPGGRPCADRVPSVRSWVSHGCRAARQDQRRDGPAPPALTSPAWWSGPRPFRRWLPAG